MGSKHGIFCEACGFLLAARHQGNSAQFFSLQVKLRAAKDAEVAKVFGR
jgi:hypothetical protein